MLVEFSVSNFRSIRDKVTLSMVANASDEHRAKNVITAPAPATPDLLRTAVIYGPNGSGKSNLLRAMDLIEDLVAPQGDRARDGMPFDPFAQDEWADTPTEIEVVFVESGVRYEYSVGFNATQVIHEALYAFPKGRPQMWFERDSRVSGDPWTFGPNLMGQKRVWQEATRPNALFLTTAVHLNSSQLKPAFSWFDDRFRSMKPMSSGSRFTMRRCSQRPNWKTMVLGLLSSLDLGINDIAVDMQKIDISMFEGATEALKRLLEAQLDGQNEVETARLLHKTPSGRDMWLDLDEESDGTQRLFGLAGPWIDVLGNNYVLAVDELDSGLHPALLRELVSLFHGRHENRSAQLIFSTHDTSILDGDLLRRDQIWFMEKDAELASHLYPLTEFSPRKRENLEKGYLQGRYGALPVFNSNFEFAEQ